MQRLLIIDAYSQIYRSFYAFAKNPRINSKGQNTSAIFGFINTMDDALRRLSPTHIALVFDPEGPTFRHEKYADYKANRDASPEEIHAAVPIIKQIAKALNYFSLTVPGYEADDVAATLAKKAAAQDFEVFILTPDKDYGQVVDEKIKIFRPHSFGGGYDVQGVDEIKNKWEVASPEQVIDLLALMGDKSDNIPGCPGVGEKTAIKLIAQFGSVENMMARTDEIKGAMRAKIEENFEKIRLSKMLATIVTDVPVEYNADDCLIRQPDVNALIKIYNDLEFRTFVAKLTGVSQTKKEVDLFSSVEEEASVVPSTQRFSLLNVVHNYIAATDLNALKGQLMQAERTAIVITTTDAPLLSKRINNLIFSVKQHTATWIEPAKIEETIIALRAFFENPSFKIATDDAKQLAIELAAYGVDLKAQFFDVSIAHYLLQPEQVHSPSAIAQSELNYTSSLTDLKNPSIEWLCEQADIIGRLVDPLRSKIERDSLNHLLYNIEFPLAHVLAKMERTGVPINEFALAQSSFALRAEMRNIENKIRDVAGDTININSPRQIGELLFEKLRLADKPRKTKTGQYVTDEATLVAMKDAHPIVGQILDYRALKKLVSTYIDALPPMINPISGRVHTAFNQTVTATGRLSSSNPNLQNIPIREENGKQIRAAFIAPQGYTFLSADYSQVELRIMAHLSADAHLLDAFNQREDIHAATAAKIFDVALENVTPDMRRKAKTANFGIIYGISSFGLSERLDLSRTEAKQFIDDYFNTFSGVKNFIDSAVNIAKEKGYAETIFHRRRYLPDINSRNTNIRSFAERNAVNAPIQGSAADIIKIAMVEVDKALKANNLNAQLILQVHDELNLLVPDSELDRTIEVVRNCMENASQLSVPLEVSIGTGANWLEAH